MLNVKIKQSNYLVFRLFLQCFTTFYSILHNWFEERQQSK